MLKYKNKEVKNIFHHAGFITVDIFCIIFIFFFEEVMITLCLFIGSQAHIYPQNQILA